MKLLDVCDRVLPEGCAILPIWIALVGPAAIPVRLLVLRWHTQMDPYPWNRPAQHMRAVAVRVETESTSRLWCALWHKTWQ